DAPPARRLRSGLRGRPRWSERPLPPAEPGRRLRSPLRGTAREPAPPDAGILRHLPRPVRRGMARRSGVQAYAAVATGAAVQVPLAQALRGAGPGGGELPALA